MELILAVVGIPLLGSGVISEGRGMEDNLLGKSSGGDCHWGMIGNRFEVNSVV